LKPLQNRLPSAANKPRDLGITLTFFVLLLSACNLNQDAAFPRREGPKMGHDLTLLIQVGIGLGVVGLATLPALIGITKQLATRAPKKNTYEDKDGSSTPEAIVAFSNKWAKLFVLVFAAAGLGCQIALSVLSTLQHTDGLFLENWLMTACWVCKTASSSSSTHDR
jgi:hypothetical protein